MTVNTFYHCLLVLSCLMNSCTCGLEHSLPKLICLVYMLWQTIKPAATQFSDKTSNCFQNLYTHFWPGTGWLTRPAGQMPAPWLGRLVCSVDGQDQQETTPTLRVEARRAWVEVYVHVCMKDGVCVSVNVVKGIKWWWCVAKTHSTTNTCSPCITPSPPATKAYSTTNTYVTPSILAAIA